MPGIVESRIPTGYIAWDTSLRFLNFLKSLFDRAISLPFWLS